MAMVLCKALLWGEDPRVALNDPRRRLYPQLPERKTSVPSVTAEEEAIGLDISEMGMEAYAGDPMGK